MSFSGILAPVQTEAERLGRSEEEIDELIEKARNKVAGEQQNDDELTLDESERNMI